MKKVNIDKKIISINRSAYHDYEVLDKLKVGIVLFGSEVKTCRNKSGVQMKGSYVTIIKGELFLLGTNISKYESSSEYFSHEPTRERKLLANKKEILKLSHQIKEKGLTLVPLEMYFEKNLIKLDIGICKGKHNYDKRESLKDKQIKIDSLRND